MPANRGELLELGHEPWSVQVIVEKDSRLYLVDETGIIEAGSSMAFSEANESTAYDHVQNNCELYDSAHMHNNNDYGSRDDIESLHSALHEARLENEWLQLQLSTRNDELERVCNERDRAYLRCLPKKSSDWKQN